MSTAYNPMNVMMGQPNRPGIPYIGGKQPGGPPKAAGGPVTINPGPATPAPPTSPAGPSNIVGPESVRAIGTGPFDSAYRQDLATYAGGLFAKPGGTLSFNPTDKQPFGGAATGGGNAPVLGMPNTMLQNALGGNPFSYTPPQPASAAPGQTTTLNMQDWLNQFMSQGGKQRVEQ